MISDVTVDRVSSETIIKGRKKYNTKQEFEMLDIGDRNHIFGLGKQAAMATHEI